MRIKFQKYPFEKGKYNRYKVQLLSKIKNKKFSSQRSYNFFDNFFPNIHNCLKYVLD